MLDRGVGGSDSNMGRGFLISLQLRALTAAA
jgi:hypothetical protein